ncbi:MAG: DNA-processing protein DprA [Bacteroidetes bacterium]|nr:DNA-processing protein DprA [Bacteroidota bacterium]
MNAKNLLSYCGSGEAVFNAGKAKLLKIPGIGAAIADNIMHNKSLILERAREEWEFIQKNNIQLTFITENAYPDKLKQCIDAPFLLFYKGNVPLASMRRNVAVVGTRNASDYGREVCQKIVADLQKYQVNIISGLAYGIDHAAHAEAVKQQMPTIGVVAHGLDTIYPAQHKSLASKMQQNGGVLSEFYSKTQADRENFPKRNRIIAGLADAVLVVETAKKGGSIITAHLAFSYNRDVLAVPGRVGDARSEGCNWLIKKNVAALVESAEDIAALMLWTENIDAKPSVNVQQKQLFLELNPVETKIIAVLQDSAEKQLHIDVLSVHCALPQSEISANLLQLELKSALKVLPGSMVKLLS